MEEQLLEIVSGRAPEGWTFNDFEEEFVIDPDTHQGVWKQCAKKAPKPTKATKRGGKAEAEDGGEDVGLSDEDE